MAGSRIWTLGDVSICAVRVSERKVTGCVARIEVIVQGVVVMYSARDTDNH
jgi:hypothetical protein